MKDIYGAWGLVAGAAEGIGKAFAEAMAHHGMHVVLVDIQQDVVAALAGQLEQEYGIQTRVLHVDLGLPHAHTQVMETVRETACRLVVYNAAFSVVRPFLKNTQEDLERYIRVNVETPLQLSHAFCKHYIHDLTGRKGLILMSSLAGLWGTQYLAPYGATKAFNHILAESLHNELHKAGFDILACIAGATKTPGYLASKPNSRGFGPAAMRPAHVAGAALKALGKQPYAVPGLGNKISYAVLTLLPRRMALGIMNSAVGKRYFHLK